MDRAKLSPPGSRRLADKAATLAVVVESQCQINGCAAICEVAVAARRLAVSAAALARESAVAAGAEVAA